MKPRVFVTGIGLITAIGDTAPDHLNAFKSCRTRLGPVCHFETEHREIHPVCEVKYNNAQLAELAAIDHHPETSRTALLGLIAAREALEMSGLTDRERRECGLISANSVGGMDRSECFYPDFLVAPKNGKLSQVRGHECGFSSEMISEQLQLGGMISTVSTACSSSANAIMLGARLIQYGRQERIMAGGCDALTRFTLNGFASLKILDREGCKPLDAERAGLNLGEGAGYLVLESEASVRSRQATAICEITGYANTCDAFHQTASSPEGEGSYQAMSQALNMAGLSPGDIGYINAHGTGTANNDLSEGIAIDRLFSPSVPPVSSTKPFTGHTLGAAGGIEAVFCVLSIRDGLLYPNLRWQHPMTELGFTPQLTYSDKQSPGTVLSNSFGFGGNDSSLIFSQC